MTIEAAPFFEELVQQGLRGRKREFILDEIRRAAFNDGVLATQEQLAPLPLPAPDPYDHREDGYWPEEKDHTAPLQAIVLEHDPAPPYLELTEQFLADDFRRGNTNPTMTLSGALVLQEPAPEE